jgi:hypothetical protein
MFRPRMTTEDEGSASGDTRRGPQPHTRVQVGYARHIEPPYRVSSEVQRFHSLIISQRNKSYLDRMWMSYDSSHPPDFVSSILCSHIEKDTKVAQQSSTAWRRTIQALKIICFMCDWAIGRLFVLTERRLEKRTDDLQSVASVSFCESCDSHGSSCRIAWLRRLSWYPITLEKGNIRLDQGILHVFCYLWRLDISKRRSMEQVEP